MLSLLNSPKFKEEFADYQKRISQITDPTLKKNLENFLNKLINSVKALDSQHEEMIFSKQAPAMGLDARDKILEIRKIIEKRLKDWDQAVNLKQ
jgi:hypothetical protein